MAKLIETVATPALLAGKVVAVPTDTLQVAFSTMSFAPTPIRSLLLLPRPLSKTMPRFVMLCCQAWLESRSSLTRGNRLHNVPPRYGVACLAQSTEAVSQLYAIKGRDMAKPVAICVAGDTVDRFHQLTASCCKHGLLRGLSP
jgi:hypothetical protein